MLLVVQRNWVGEIYERGGGVHRSLSKKIIETGFGSQKLLYYNLKAVTANCPLISI